MSKYLDVQGKEVTADDPTRLVWYGLCGYWTDDWDKLVTTNIPACPSCGAVGFQIDAKEWFSGAERFDQNNNLGYLKFLKDNKEKCFLKRGAFMNAWYQESRERSE